MKQRVIITTAAALWSTAVTSMFWAFSDQDTEGLFELANMIALAACVPTFYLCADYLLAKHYERISHDHAHVVDEVCEAIGYAEASREVSRMS